MAERLAKISEFGEYTAYHFNAAQPNTLLDTEVHGGFLGNVIVGTVGTSTVITLSNGPSSTASNIFAVITPTVAGSFSFGCVCDRGLYVTIAGSGMDVTIMANAMGV